MNTQTVLPCTTQLADQPTSWPWLYILPQTHYVCRQRATNSHQYNAIPKDEVSRYLASSRKPSYPQRGINGLTAARKRAWLSLKRFGREVVHALVKWCVLPLAVMACISMVDVSPAELPADYYTVEASALLE